MPSVTQHYQNLIFDSSRWSAYTPRDGDVIVCTSYKAGTTWTQMICGLLIHQNSKLPRPLAELSPWWDMNLEPLESLVANYDAQDHRRFIKTHTALDGLPYFENVSYVVCVRDPRDVFMSLQNHLANSDMEQALALIEAQGIEVEIPPELPDDIHERFELWLTTPTFEWEQDGLPYWSHFHHAETFWQNRDLPNIHLLHYADLKTDLEGEMRRLAGLLSIDVREDLWPELVHAATFDAMKTNAERTAPDTNHGIWISNQQFFNKGTNAQWQGVLSDADLERYQELTRNRYDHDLLNWLEQGAAALTNQTEG